MTWDLTPDYVKRPLGPRNGKDGKYDGFGLCIYCKGQSTSLRREHIYPKGLGGVLEIRDASCRECEQETHAFEGRAMQALLLPRLIEGFKTSQPQTIPLQRIQNGSWVDVQVEHSGHYARANMPVFLPAKAFLGTSLMFSLDRFSATSPRRLMMNRCLH